MKTRETLEGHLSALGFEYDGIQWCWEDWRVNLEEDEGSPSGLRVSVGSSQPPIMRWVDVLISDPVKVKYMSLYNTRMSELIVLFRAMRNTEEMPLLMGIPRFSHVLNAWARRGVSTVCQNHKRGIEDEHAFKGAL